MSTNSAEQKKKTVLCADIGSSSLKTALIDETGAVLAYERRKFNLSNPSIMWFDALCNSTKEIAKKVSFENLSAVSISGNGPTIAVEHESGHTDIALWNDSRYQFKNSSYKGASLFLPRILSYLSVHSSHTDKPVCFFSGPEFLVWQLCGERTTLLPEKRFASAYWTPEDITEAGMTEKNFPPFILLGEKSGSLLTRASIAMGIETKGKAIPVFCAGPDFTSALIGTNTLKPGTICDRAGSSEGINLCCEKPLASEKIRNLPSVITGLFNAGILIPDSGIRFSAIKKSTSFASSSYKEYVAYLLENRHEKGYRQMIELAQECGNALSCLLSSYTKKMDRRVTVTGGQARNNLWLQIKATIMNAAIDIPSCTDAELLGNAAAAFYGLTVFPDLITASNSLFSIQKTLYPDGESYLT